MFIRNRNTVSKHQSGAPWMKRVSLSLSLSQEALWRRPQGELLHWGPWKILRKSPDTGISLHGGPFPSEGNLVHGGELVYQAL